MNKIIYFFNRLTGKTKRIRYRKNNNALGVFTPGYGGAEEWEVIIDEKVVASGTFREHMVRFANEEYPNIPWKE
jgi:hypothetical protein